MIVSLLAMGCGSEKGGDTRISVTTANVSDVLQQEMAKEDSKNDNTVSVSVSEPPEASSVASAETSTESSTESSTETSAEEPVVSEGSDVDIDLTLLSSTVVYSQVYDMIMSPEDYLEKEVRIHGPFVTLYDEVNDYRYYACIIQDATACCAQGFEFVLEGEHTYPDDYPPEGTEIVVSGEFDRYYEGENSYITLRHAVIEKVEEEPNLQAQP